jgi:hypothetical protein
MATPDPQTSGLAPQQQQQLPPPVAGEIRIGGKYRLGKKIGAGSFGDIYLGTNARGH